MEDNTPVWINIAYDILNQFAYSQDLDIDDCLESAYNVIKNRTGKLHNGTFIKD